MSMQVLRDLRRLKNGEVLKGDHLHISCNGFPLCQLNSKGISNNSRASAWQSQIGSPNCPTCDLLLRGEALPGGATCN